MGPNLKIPVGNEELIALRDRLNKDNKLRSRKSTAVAASDTNLSGIVASVSKIQLVEPIDLRQSMVYVLGMLTSSTASSLDPNRRFTSLLALEVLASLLIASAARKDESSVIELYTITLLNQIVDVLYSSLDSTPLFAKSRLCLVALLSLSALLNSTIVSEQLRRKIDVDPWKSKRTITLFEALLQNLSVEEFVGSFAGETGGVEGVLTKVIDGMRDWDEVAVLSGRVAMKWIQKVWMESTSTARGFWLTPLAESMRSSIHGRVSISLYVLTALFQVENSAFKELLIKGGFMVLKEDGSEKPVARTLNDMMAALEILKAGNGLGLIEADSTAELTPNRIRLPSTLISTCLSHSSHSLRFSSFSLLVIHNLASSPLSSSTFDLLKVLYINSAGEDNSEARMKLISLSGTLLVRLRDSSWKAGKKGNTHYVEQVKSFLIWWTDTLLCQLNPASPFRIRVNALALLEIVLQIGLDPDFNVSPSSTSSTPSHTQGWPFSLPLVAKSTFTLLRLLLSTYTALRNTAISLLERFPSPLPGYAGKDGEDRARVELLIPALSMIVSGREAQASAGAVILDLIYRKWVLEGEVVWDLGEIGGWQLDRVRTDGPLPFSFINAMMDLAETQLDVYASDLAKAATTQPIHGVLLSLRHLFSSLPLNSPLLSNTERRIGFLRALRIVERVWDVSAVVLAATAPEGSTGATVDLEEARVLKYVGVEEGEGEGDDANDSGSNGGPMDKQILSATWRAMKEAGELLETLLVLPTTLDLDGFQAIWTLDDVRNIGNMFTTWLSRVRHRGAMMAIYPCYSRVCSALLLRKDWMEVKRFPLEWLNRTIDSITLENISITRRSAGLPYSILAVLTAIVSDRPSFNLAFTRLFDIAESKSSDIKDESRVHAMNTLRMTFLDAKCAAAVAPFIERAFALSIGMFWSTNWICRNVAMLLYASLVTRAFGSRRLNRSRDYASLVQRLPASDFFASYPSLHAVLLSELEFSSKKHMNDLPTTDLSSSLFSILMLFSLLQTLNTLDGEGLPLSDKFINVIRECASSRVWKIRDAAADALTGIIPPAEIPRMCLTILDKIEKCGENELHGRLVQVLRLLEVAGELSSESESQLASRIEALAIPILAPRHSFSARTTFMHIARVFAAATLRLSARLYKTAHQELEASRSWTSTSHLPSAENFITACFSLVLLYDPSSTTLITTGLVSPFLSIQKETLDYLEATTREGSVSEEIAPSLIDLALSETSATECRVQAIGLLSSSDMVITSAEEDDTLISELISIHLLSVIVPLREALVPWIAHLISQEENPQLDVMFEILEACSHVDQSVETRECAARAILKLKDVVIVDPIKQDLFARLVLRLIQDDHESCREYASELIAHRWTGGASLTDRAGIEEILSEVGPIRLDQMEAEFKVDLEQLKTRSSLLFLVEKSNIYVDDLVESTCSLAFTDIPENLQSILSSLLFLTEELKRGPLETIGNMLFCKWASRIVFRYDQLDSSQKSQLAEYDELIALLRLSL